MQETELEKVKSRIRALLQKTSDKGCTEQEAMSAADKVGQLLDAYNLTMNEVLVHMATCEIKKFYLNFVNRHPFAGCVTHIADFCDCKVWRKTLKFEHKTEYVFFGFTHDIEYAVFLSETIFGALESEVENFKNTEDYFDSRSKRSASQSFMHGMADRIAYRLDKMKRDRDMKMEKEMESRRIENNCTSLVLAQKAEKIEEDFKKLGVKLISTKRNISVSNYTAYRSGTNSADKVNLNRPLGESSKSKVAIG